MAELDARMMSALRGKDIDQLESLIYAMEEQE